MSGPVKDGERKVEDAWVGGRGPHRPPHPTNRMEVCGSARGGGGRRGGSRRWRRPRAAAAQRLERGCGHGPAAAATAAARQAWRRAAVGLMDRWGGAPPAPAADAVAATAAPRGGPHRRRVGRLGGCPWGRMAGAPRQRGGRATAAVGGGRPRRSRRCGKGRVLARPGAPTGWERARRRPRGRARRRAAGRRGALGWEPADKGQTHSRAAARAACPLKRCAIGCLRETESAYAKTPWPGVVL